jgi:hypothetical protein
MRRAALRSARHPPPPTCCGARRPCRRSVRQLRGTSPEIRENEPEVSLVTNDRLSGAIPLKWSASSARPRGGARGVVPRRAGWRIPGGARLSDAATSAIARGSRRRRTARTRRAPVASSSCSARRRIWRSEKEAGQSADRRNHVRFPGRTTRARLTGSVPFWYRRGHFRLAASASAPTQYRPDHASHSSPDIDS